MAMRTWRSEILALSAQLGLDKDVGVSGGEAEDAALAKIDNYLCEIKELQIRDGLHVFGCYGAVIFKAQKVFQQHFECVRKP